MRRGALGSVLVLGAGLGASACAGSSAGARHAGGAGRGARAAGIVAAVLAAPKEVLAAADPEPDGLMWVLSGSARAKTLTSIDLSSGKVLASLGVSRAAGSLAASSTGLLAVGLATATAGAVELLNVTTGAEQGFVPVGAPVRSLAFGADGTTLYVLDGDAASTSVTVVDSVSDRILATFGQPHDAVGIVADPSQRSVWTLDRSGVVEQTSTSTGRPTSVFPTGGPGLAITESPSGGLLYVLEGGSSVSRIAVVSTAKDSVERVLPAAARSVGLAVSPSGGMLYDLVGAPGYGNIQEIPVRTNAS